jgi:hypothetical protein
MAHWTAGNIAEIGLPEGWAYGNRRHSRRNARHPASLDPMKLGLDRGMRAYDKIIADLQPGEELLWCEEPSPGTYFLKKSGLLGVLLFGFVLGVAICAEPDGSGHWILIFFSVLLFGGLVQEAIAAFRTLYAITNRRLVILHPAMLSTELESYYPPDIDFVKKTKRKNGSGSIIFAAVRERSGKRTQTVEIGFWGIEDVDAVETLLLSLRSPKSPIQPPEVMPGQPSPSKPGQVPGDPQS